MKKAAPVFMLLIVAFISLPTAKAQITLQAGGGIGYVVPAADYKGETADYYAGKNYGLSNGFNIHAKGRVGLIGLRLTGEVSYSSLSNDGESEPGKGKVEIKHKILAIKIGPEFHLSVPLLPITPYLGANVALSSFSGETTFQGVAKVSSATYSMESATRLGLGFSGGVILSVGPAMRLDLGFGYNLMNASGKEWKDVNQSQDQRIDTYLALNDDKDPAYKPLDDKHVVENGRNIQSIQITATIMFGL
ncbi:MAG TPA: hypothetical protein DCP63_15925 [Bacteroidetes bacterium]|nr:hypothetical protein [Bacteroidota bacterium]